MVASNLISQIRHQNNQNTYRYKLAHEVVQDFPLRLLPNLLELSLEFIDQAGSSYNLTDAVQLDQHITLVGAVGSGRRLALQQWALAWMANTAAPVPTLLALPRIDDGVSPPEHMLTAFLPNAPIPTERQQLLPFWRRAATPTPAKRGLMLITGWDELTPERREQWRQALLNVAQTTPAIQLIIAVPPDEPTWPDFMPLALAPNTAARVTRWIEQIAPAEQSAALLNLLVPNRQLHPLGEQLFEIVLLVWLAGQSYFPQTRSDLYAQAIAALLELPTASLEHEPIVRELQLLAAYAETPAHSNNQLIEINGAGIPHFIHPHIGRYFAARQIVAEQRYDLLQALDTEERTALALFITTMLPDPLPLYKAIWSAGQLSSEDVLTLGRCLRERAPRNPGWTLRVIGALAQLARNPNIAAQPQARKLLYACMSAFDNCLDTLTTVDQGVQRFIMGLFELLPTDLAVPRIFHLIYNPELNEPFGWQLADYVIAQNQLAQEDWIPPVAFMPVLARWIYIRVRQNTAGYQQLDPTIAATAIKALAASEAGETRKLQVAATWLDDANQAVEPRQAALALLADSTQPAALTVIERASNDADPAIRSSALEALSRHDPERAVLALGRAASDESAAWELRLEAIRTLGHHLAIGTGSILARCASDAILPLHVRMQAINALSQDQPGLPYLHQVVGDSHVHPEIRAAAARQLGSMGYRPASNTLIDMLEQPTTVAALAIGCSNGLGLLGDRAASGPLQRLLARTADDVALTLTIIDALGRIGDPEASEPLSHLLGTEALQRLQQPIPSAMLEQAPETVLDNQSLPTPIANRLSSALASSATADIQPTSLKEFLAMEADRVRAASAWALARIGGNSARAMLLAALLDNVTEGATSEVIEALAHIEGTESIEALGYLLNAEQLDPLARWLVVRHLTEHPDGTDLMHRMLMQTTVDPFTRGALAEGLGQRGIVAALPTLRQIAEDDTSDQQLRAQALLAIGLLNDSSAEHILIHMIGNTQEPLALRGLAAEYLSTSLSSESRHVLREMLRRDRPPVPIIVGALRTLGRIHDREALPLLLRYSQDENAEIMQATITALTDLGDSSVAPMLVRLAHHTTADHALRLQAAGALLRIGGDGYRPLLRVYLEQGPLPLRLLALEYLIDTGNAIDDLLAMLADESWPHTLRLRLVEHLANNPAAAPVLTNLLAAPNDNSQLRAYAAEALGRLHYTEALPLLIHIAEDQAGPTTLRMYCIGALEQLNAPEGWATISRLANDDNPISALKQRAIEALQALIQHTS